VSARMLRPGTKRLLGASSKCECGLGSVVRRARAGAQGGVAQKFQRRHACNTHVSNVTGMHPRYHGTPMLLHCVTRLRRLSSIGSDRWVAKARVLHPRPSKYFAVACRTHGGACCVAIVVLFAVANPIGCSSQACVHLVQSEEEARRALSIFLTSDTPASRRLIAELRTDGMRDEFLTEMRSGCSTCVVRRGYKPTEDPYKWYVFTWIAPREEKKSVNLEIDCENAVWLESKAYGG